MSAATPPAPGKLRERLELLRRRPEAQTSLWSAVPVAQPSGSSRALPRPRLGGEWQGWLRRGSPAPRAVGAE